MSGWIRFDLGAANMPRVPRKPACYAVFLDGQLGYVGQTTDLSKRISAHGIRCGIGDSTMLTNWGVYRSVVVKAHLGSRFGDWAMRELRLIRRLQPRFNSVGSTRGRHLA